MRLRGVELAPGPEVKGFYMSLHLHRPFTDLFGVLALACVTTLAYADETTEHIDGLIVEDAVISPAEKGETAYLRIKLTNYGGRQVTLHSIRSPASGNAGLVTVDPIYGEQQAGDLVVLRDETLNLASSHIRVELMNTNRSMKADSVVPFELVFRRFSMLAEAHAH